MVRMMPIGANGRPEIRPVQIAGAAHDVVDADQRVGAEREPEQDADRGHGLDQRAADQAPVQLAPPGGRGERAAGADARRLGDRGDAAIDRAQHPDHDHDRQDQALEQRELLRPGHRQVLGRRGRPELRVEPAADQDVADVDRAQQQARREAREEQIADRDVGGQAVEDQHHRGRDHGAERAAGADRADRELAVVAQAQHLRQGDQPEQHDLAADDAGHRRHQHGDQRGLDREPARQGAREHVHRPVEVLRHARALEDAGHEHEQAARPRTRTR